MKIGILGGTFDPIHNGHIKMAEAAFNELSLDKVFIIPTNIPPHKHYNREVSANDRINMCRLATKSYNYIEVSDLEIKREGISYTFLTLREIKDKYKDSELYFIIGADMFLTIQNWKEPIEIFKLANICVFNRAGIDKLTLEEHYNNLMLKYGDIINILFLDIPIVDISSTDVRTMIKAGFDIGRFVPECVKGYIIENKLYL